MSSQDRATEIMEKGIDGVTNAQMTVSHEHHEMHEGSHYFIKTYVENTGSSGTSDEFIFTTPANGKRIHAKASLYADTDTTVNIYEGSTVSANGTEVTPMNNNRNSTNTATLTAYAGPTVTDDGDIMWSSRNGGGRRAVGVGLGFNYEIIVKPETIYLFRITKNTAADTVVDIDFFWYEHTPSN